MVSPSRRRAAAVSRFSPRRRSLTGDTGPGSSRSRRATRFAPARPSARGTWVAGNGRGEDEPDQAADGDAGRPDDEGRSSDRLRAEDDPDDADDGQRRREDGEAGALDERIPVADRRPGERRDAGDDEEGFPRGGPSPPSASPRRSPRPAARRWSTRSSSGSAGDRAAPTGRPAGRRPSRTRRRPRRSRRRRSSLPSPSRPSDPGVAGRPSRGGRLTGTARDGPDAPRAVVRRRCHELARGSGGNRRK